MSNIDHIQILDDYLKAAYIQLGYSKSGRLVDEATYGINKEQTEAYDNQDQKIKNKITTITAAIELMEEKDGWISVADRLPEDANEVEIAYWDGCYMCRLFGAYIDEDNDAGWFSGSERLDSDCSFIVTHWRAPTPLPIPPKDIENQDD